MSGHGVGDGGGDAAAEGQGREGVGFVESEWDATDIGYLSRSTVVITGANRGLGFETARVLVGHGATVVLACRDVERAQQARTALTANSPDARVDFVALDLASLASVQAAVEVIGSRHDQVNVVINSAGAMFPARGLSEDGVELTFATNHVGPFAFTLGLRDLLTVDGPAKPGRVVTVSSGGHKFARLDLDDPQFGDRRYNGWAAYAQAKLANLVFTAELRRRLCDAGLPVIAVAAHPGIVRTGFGDNTAFKGLLDQRGLGRLADRLVNPIRAGVLPALRAAVDPRVSGGEFFGPRGWLGIRGTPVPGAMPGRALDGEVGARLWSLSEQITGLSLGKDGAR